MKPLPTCVNRPGCIPLFSSQLRASQCIRCSSDIHQILRTEFHAHRCDSARRTIVQPHKYGHHGYHIARAPQPQNSSRVSKSTSCGLDAKHRQDRDDPITSRARIRQTVRAITSSGIQRQQQTAPAAESYDEDQTHDSVGASDAEESLSQRSTSGSAIVSNRSDSSEAGDSLQDQDPREHVSASTSRSKRGLRQRPPMPVPASVDGAHLAALLKTMRQARKLGLPDASQILSAEPKGFTMSKTLVPPARALSHMSASLKDSFKELKKLSMFRDRMAERARLPMMAKDAYERLMVLLDEADVLIIAGQTGCGKTTQVPQIILDYAIHRGLGASCNIICTQPRRISATSIARRVAHERCEPVGRSVGYHVRFDRRRPSQDGSILYCTNGVLLKQLQEDSDFYMTRTSHIIIDEVHERSLATDHLLTLFRELIHQRKARGQSFPKLILMSATIDTKAFVDYYRQPSSTADARGESLSLETRLLEVEGRMFPVERKFLEDFLPQLQAETDASVRHLLQSSGDHPEFSTKPYIKAELEFAAKTPIPAKKADDDGSGDDEHEDVTGDAARAVESDDPAECLSPCGLAAATIAYVAKNTKSGDILVFVPGNLEIDKTSELLTERKPLGLNVENGDFKLFKLHSALGELNDEVFKPVLQGCRRIVVSTNIAETSLTLPKVEHVIDMGKVRYYTHDHLSGDREFAARWISKASSKQRLGRAGRVLPGTYYALFTRERYDSLEDHLDPEMARISIVGTCLEVVAQGISSDVPTFLNRCPTPPKPEAVTAALETLKQLGAITEHHQLTALGRVLSLLPLQPAEGKAVLLGILFKCLEPMLIIACSDSDAPLINHPLERTLMSASRRRYAGKSESDLLSVVNAFKAYDAALVQGNREELQMLISEHYMRPVVHQEIRLLTKQIYEHLAYAELVPHLEDPQGQLFSQIPPYLNTNAHNIPLLKALLMSCMTTNLAVAKRHSGREWITRGNEKALMEPRTVNVTSAKVALEEYGRIRAAGDMVAYSSRRDMQRDQYPWIMGGSMITPLTAVLFASAAERKGDRITLDGIVDVEFDVKNNILNLDQKTTTTLLLESRKAVDRFLLTAFEDLRYTNFKGRLGKSYEIEQQEAQEHLEAEGWSLAQTQSMATRSRTDFTNTILRNSELRDTFVNGVAEVLQAEDDALMEVFRRQKAEYEISKAEEAQKVDQERADKVQAINAANQAGPKEKVDTPTAMKKDRRVVTLNSGNISLMPQENNARIRYGDPKSATTEAESQSPLYRSENGGMFQRLNLSGQGLEHGQRPLYDGQSTTSIIQHSEGAHG